MTDMKQPEALRLAQFCRAIARGLLIKPYIEDLNVAAALLERQYAEIESLRDKLDELAKQEPVGWQRRVKFPRFPGEIALWEQCSKHEATSYFEKSPAREYRAVYLAAGARPVEPVQKLRPDFIAGYDAGMADAKRIQAAQPAPGAVAGPFQDRVKPWLVECFGEMIAGDREERNYRFLEEALELVQSLGCTQGDAHQLVDYVYGRPIGVPAQEAGGVMVTLAALCLANGMDMHSAGEVELARINEPATVKKIRAKQAAKPIRSPLPMITPTTQPAPAAHDDTSVQPSTCTWSLDDEDSSTW